MTRPVPGPPECECPMAPPRLWTTHYGAVDPVTMIEHNPACPVHGDLQLDKHLTDAECAAEFWRAEGDHCLASEGYDIDWFSGDLLRDEDIACDVHATWHRFATRPHAFDAT